MQWKFQPFNQNITPLKDPIRLQHRFIVVIGKKKEQPPGKRGNVISFRSVFVFRLRVHTRHVEIIEIWATLLQCENALSIILLGPTMSCPTCTTSTSWTIINCRHIFIKNKNKKKKKQQNRGFFFSLQKTPVNSNNLEKGPRLLYFYQKAPNVSGATMVENCGYHLRLGQPPKTIISVHRVAVRSQCCPSWHKTFQLKRKKSSLPKIVEKSCILKITAVLENNKK